ncbi:MAG TPA: hypothetical protein VLT35_07320 [Methanocella sp.]|nr:hypothetical protein [Methanocella sp.]
MSDVQEVLRRSIQGKCGAGGLMKFSAIYSSSFENDDGSPDMSGIIEALGHTFPPYQAADIIILFKKKMKIREIRSAKTATASNASRACGDMSQTFARYFSDDSGQIREIVNDARRLRMAMGKPVPLLPLPQPGGPASPAPGEGPARADAEAEEAPETGTPTARVPEVAVPKSKDEVTTAPRAAEPAAPPAALPKEPIAGPASTIDGEVRQFAYGRKVCTSIDIIDFIRYLKDKGYSFQEQIVLEKIYVTIEERKKEARSAIEKEVEGFIDATQAPDESDICGLVERLDSAGLVFDEDDVRRAVRDALMRRSSNG